MAKTSFMQNSFLSGEFSAFSQGLSNTEEYYSGMNLCLNYIPTDEGALTRRSGFRFSAEARANVVRLVPFQTAADDSFVCELTALKLRFHTNGVVRDNLPRLRVLSISTATPPVVTTDGAHGFATADTVIFHELSEDTAPYLYQRQFRITVLTSTTFSVAHTGSLGTGSMNGSVFASAILLNEEVSEITEVTTPYLATQLADIKYTEEANNLYLLHGSHEPNILNGTTLVITEAVFLDGPYLDENTTATTLTFSGVSGSVTVTASAITGINSNTGFQTTDVGRLIRVNTGTTLAPQWSWLRITARASTTSVTATILGFNLASGSANTKWRLGLYSDTTGWPTHGVIHENRLWLVSDGAPGRLDASRTVDGLNNTSFFQFAPTTGGPGATTDDGTVADSSAIAVNFAGAGRKNIHALQVVDSGMLALADNSEWLVRASSFDDPISPFSVQVRQVTNFGSADALPVRAGRNVLAIQSLGRAVMEYRVDQGDFDGNDFARRARHLTAAGVVELAYAKVPVPILWCRRADQRLIGCSYRNDLEGKQAGWHRHNVAYAADPNDTAALGPVLSIAASPFSDFESTRNDTLWAAILRDGIACVEYLTQIFDDTFLPNEAIFVDSAGIFLQEDLGVTWQLQSGNTYRFFGLDRLVGDTVDLTFRGVDNGSGVVQTGGYVDMTIAAVLDGVASAYETSTRTDIAVGGLTFSSAYISDLNATSGPTSFATPPANAAFLIGDNGKRYLLRRIADQIDLWDVDAGTAGPNRAGVDIFADATAATTGNEPGGLWNGTGNVGAAAIIPETPYVVFLGVAASGATTDRYVSYYKVNAAGSLQFMGIFATGDGSLNVQFSPNQDNDAFSAVGHFFKNRVLSSPSHYATEYPIALAYAGEGRSTLVAIPAIQDILNTSPQVVNGASLWLARENDLVDIGMEDLFSIDGYYVKNPSRGFFLPEGTNRGVRFFTLFHPTDLAEHVAGTASPAIAFLTTNAPLFPTGLISSCVMDNGADADEANAVLKSRESSSNHRFDTGVFPFTDQGTNFDGTAGTVANNFYGNAAVFPSSKTDITQPWFCFFPRFYKNQSQDNKLGIRVFKYTPSTGKFTFLDFQKGQLFDFAGDGVDTSFEPEFASIWWNRTTFELTAVVHSQDNSEWNLVVARFGTFDPNDSTLSVAAGGHVDAVIGLNYSSKGQILRPDLNSGAQNGPGLGKRRRTDRFNGLFYRTGQVKFGTVFTNLIIQRLGDLDTLGRRPLFSGVSEIRALEDTYTYDSMMAWEQARPEPGAIVAVAGHIQTQDV